MTQSQTRHAERVVGQFREMLSATGRQHVGEKHFAELALLIEAAIDAALLDENAHYVSELERLVRRMQRSGEHFDTEAGSPQVVNE
jgi:hypothetical protein